eukprot:765403-Rhodomonas_salina.2
MGKWGERREVVKSTKATSGCLRMRSESCCSACTGHVRAREYREIGGTVRCVSTGGRVGQQVGG